MYRDDSKLIQACLSKDESAWKELVERYAGLVYSIAFRYGMSHADADDVVQIVFTIVFRNLKNLRNQKLLVAWLIPITRRECKRFRERSPDHAEIPDSLPNLDPSAQEEVEVWERRYLVRLAIRQLEPRCQELVRALFLESPAPTYKELAARLEMPIGSVGPTRIRCLEKLEEILTDMGFDFRF